MVSKQPDMMQLLVAHLMTMNQVLNLYQVEWWSRICKKTPSWSIELMYRQRKPLFPSSEQAIH